MVQYIPLSRFSSNPSSSHIVLELVFENTVVVSVEDSVDLAMFSNEKD
jgi:hypothetical protein